MKKPSPVVKILMLTISATCFAVGLAAILTEYAPASSTRFGLTDPLFGDNAKLFGAISMLVGLLPLLIFCKTAKQASIFGSLLFVLLMVVIFGGIYFTH